MLFYGLLLFLQKNHFPAIPAPVPISVCSVLLESRGKRETFSPFSVFASPPLVLFYGGGLLSPSHLFKPFDRRSQTRTVFLLRVLFFDANFLVLCKQSTHEVASFSDSARRQFTACSFVLPSLIGRFSPSSLFRLPSVAVIWFLPRCRDGSCWRSPRFGFLTPCRPLTWLHLTKNRIE